MALPSSGAITFANVNTELGAGSTTQRSLNDPATRTLFGKASGQISMSDGHGKSTNFTFNQTITTDTANYNLRKAAVAAGWNSVSPLIATVTINPGVVVYANSTSDYAFDTGVAFPGGTTLALVNNGYIIGMGGRGGDGSRGGGGTIPVHHGVPASAGGPALRAQQAITIINNGTIGGGGGGGGGGGAGGHFGHGGGGGGGRSGRINSSGGTGAWLNDGGAGTFSAGGNGGRGSSSHSDSWGGDGAQGGNWGAAGGGRGSSGGAAVVGNGFITWNATGTRMGAVT